ncbi:exonuclease [Candidatus Bathyarchaeota archaeon]|nr:exonuclease [Candidatus Bathyarchaeota archaeon]NIR16637.1 exonuclease [Desulfobacterales bacterium]NIU81748.1 exonuclease [Candidatus Bathyarchaeota archaeon]NIV68380.1 exonuclease [Candidatus Bathyarchaeota archaeon]NIW16700.1 exonuclease [Candidatus Bathyarchaeota archaeon]
MSFRLRAEASITKRGTVLLGKFWACDGFHEDRPVRVITHAHSDHLSSLGRSLKECEAVMMTPATKDLINVIKNPSYLLGGNVKTLRYEEAYAYKDERMTLHYSDHILGAAQVLVEDEEGRRILYTGDFRLPYTPIIEADILVIESTYGSPSCVRPFTREVKKVLVNLVEETVKEGPVYLFGYHGKIQEVMQILYEAHLGVPFIASDKVFQVSRICEMHGMKCATDLLLSSSEEARSMLRHDDPLLAFYHTSSRRHVNDGGLRIYVSGWQFSAACRMIGRNEFRVALSDHSDFYGLLRYVENSRPKMVITDNHRSKYGAVLAREIERRLNIPARPLPA